MGGGSASYWLLAGRAGLLARVLRNDLLVGAGLGAGTLSAIPNGTADLDVVAGRLTLAATLRLGYSTAFAAEEMPDGTSLVLQPTLAWHVGPSTSFTVSVVAGTTIYGLDAAELYGALSIGLAGCAEST